jgi:ferredoxin
LLTDNTISTNAPRLRSRGNEEQDPAQVASPHPNPLPKGKEGGKGDRSNLCEAPEGPFRQIGPVPFSAQAARCLHCDCRGQSTCKLRKYSAIYGADTKRFKGQRRQFEIDARHAEIVFEPGKCIDCGLCIQIAQAAGEPLGLTFVGRGFDVRVAVPLDRSLAEALTKAAAECVAACPTAALAWKRP